MERLIAKNPKNKERIFPYIGGEEVNDDPTHSHRRYVINFGETPEEEARRGWPSLMQILEERVKPGRLISNDRGAKGKWWQFIRTRPELQAAIVGIERVLVTSSVSKYRSFAFIPSTMCISHNVTVFAVDSNSFFAILQSEVHVLWATFFSSSLEDRLGYRPSDCFETFPFPACLLPGYSTGSELSGRRGGAKGGPPEARSATRVRSDHPSGGVAGRTPQPSREQADRAARLEAVGREYYEFRAELMVKNDEGLTKTYNRFHDPEETSPDILRLRELHAAMDRAVLDAYGWTDIDTRCEFLLDYEEEDEDADGALTLPSPAGRGVRRRKKPWRYRWPDETRDEVLARLLDLNRRRAEEERLHLGEALIAADNVADEYKPKPKGRARPRKGTTDDSQGGLF